MNKINLQFGVINRAELPLGARALRWEERMRKRAERKGTTDYEIKNPVAHRRKKPKDYFSVIRRLADWKLKSPNTETITYRCNLSDNELSFLQDLHTDSKHFGPIRIRKSSRDMGAEYQIVPFTEAPDIVIADNSRGQLRSNGFEILYSRLDPALRTYSLSLGHKNQQGKIERIQDLNNERLKQFPHLRPILLESIGKMLTSPQSNNRS